MAETTFTLWRQRLGYGIADLSCNLVWQMISLYLMFFYTDVMGLPAYYVGLMFLVTRLVDGVADVLMGLVIDNTATRWGRCRPWLLIGALPFGLLCILAFYVPDFGTTGKLLYAFITYLCLSFLYTLVNIPFCAMLPFLTSDSAERTTLSAVRILLGSLGATIVAVATLPLVGMLGKGDQQQGFLYIAVIFGVLAAFFLLVSFRNVEEKITLTGERMTLKRAWISLRANRPWWIFASNIFLMWGAFFFQTGALVYFFHYYVGNTADGGYRRDLHLRSPARHPHRPVAGPTHEKTSCLSGGQRGQSARDGDDDAVWHLRPGADRRGGDPLPWRRSAHGYLFLDAGRPGGLRRVENRH